MIDILEVGKDNIHCKNFSYCDSSEARKRCSEKYLLECCYFDVVGIRFKDVSADKFAMLTQLQNECKARNVGPADGKIFMTSVE